jgi:hypothetical protein
MNAINQEIREMSESIRVLNETIALLRDRIRVFQVSDADMPLDSDKIEIGILEDELIQTELLLEHAMNKQYELEQLKEYQLNCEHSFVDDLIDINPDESKCIKYCVYCLFTDEN